MDTAFDWITIIIFAGLVTHFLQQSADRRARQNPLWQYAIAAAGCAVGDWLGNTGQRAAAVVVIAATLGFIAYVHFSRPDAREDH
ncbi:XrtV sorting system accessory protein [Sphingomonas sp.]|uniref:XrtV sorting system accessory protein n=1 Tax=Sphingomonas sp. TaxID=28214 RepID=UPI0025EC8C7B|nr:XrtV sorting system accessory protein [Sphingomonas sp.]MBV9528632.1 hypothetical protein [Sphingomonas sp.]